MSTTKKLSNITPAQIASKGVQALSNRPNSSSRYSEAGLSATQLKLWFDNLATFLAEKINEVQNVIAGEDAAKYIRLALDEYGLENLNDLVSAFKNSTFAEQMLMVYDSPSLEKTVPLQTKLNNISLNLGIHQENIVGLVNGAVTRIEIALNKSTNVMSLKGFNAKGELLFQNTIEIETSFSDVGLTVVDGMLCAIYEEE